MHFLGENHILVRIQGIRKCQQFDQNSIDDSFACQKVQQNSAKPRQIWQTTATLHYPQTCRTENVRLLILVRQLQSAIRRGKFPEADEANKTVMDETLAFGLFVSWLQSVEETTAAIQNKG